MVPLLADRDISSHDKVRIIALYILYRDGVPDEDRKRLFQHARLSISEQDMVNNLVYLGARVVKGPNERSSRTRIKGKYASSEDDYELSRYRPIVKQLIEEQATNRLDNSLFPYIRDVPADVAIPTAVSHRGGALRPSVGRHPSGSSSSSSVAGQGGGSLRSARPTWHKAPSARLEATSQSRQRYIIFVAGGMTYSEQRIAYMIGEALGKEVIIGRSFLSFLVLCNPSADMDWDRSTDLKKHSCSCGQGLHIQSLLKDFWTTSRRWGGQVLVAIPRMQDR